MNKLLFGALLWALAVIFPISTMAQVGISVNIGLPPPIQFAEPPDVIVMPDTDNVYVVPGVDVDMFFWNGFWWRPWEGRWYRSRYYNRGWGYYGNVPSFYFDVDPGGEDTTETVIGTATRGTMSGLITDDLTGSGRTGRTIDTGNGNKPGAFKAIGPDHNNRDRN